jgi:heme exporter protein D
VSMLAFWTWVAVAVLIVVPPVVFVLFLRDATRLLREMAPPRSDEKALDSGGPEAQA